MNILLWVLQGVAALLYGASGVMKVFMFDKVSTDVPSFGALPREAWMTLGILELICTIGLIVPSALWTEVEIRANGLVQRVRVLQKFRNDTAAWLEGVYVFPLPEGAAVDRMRLHIGDRVVEGEIRERAEAKAEYEAAKAAGQRASLVEQERPNIFTTSVANVGPGDEIAVEIEYQDRVLYRDGRFSLRSS